MIIPFTHFQLCDRMVRTTRPLPTLWRRRQWPSVVTSSPTIRGSWICLALLPSMRPDMWVWEWGNGGMTGWGWNGVGVWQIEGGMVWEYDRLRVKVWHKCRVATGDQCVVICKFWWNGNMTVWALFLPSQGRKHSRYVRGATVSEILLFMYLLTMCTLLCRTNPVKETTRVRGERES